MAAAVQDHAHRRGRDPGSDPHHRLRGRRVLRLRYGAPRVGNIVSAGPARGCLDSTRGVCPAMRRTVITIGIVAILVSSCAENDTPQRFSATLQDRVASIRELAEAGKPGLALARLRNMVASVTSQLERGRIEEGWALEILESAQAVELQLRLLPATPSASEEPSPTPVEEGGGEEGSGGGGGQGQGQGPRRRGARERRLTARLSTRALGATPRTRGALAPTDTPACTPGLEPLR